MMSKLSLDVEAGLLEIANKLMSKLVLFDVGAVLLKLANNKMYAEMERISGKPKIFLMKRYAEIERKANSGEIGASGFVGLTRELLGKDLTDEEVRRIIALPWIGQADGVVEIKKRVRVMGQYVGIFSNISSLGLEILPGEHPSIYETFGGPVFYSYQHKATKPQNQMYDAVKAYAKEKGIEKVILIDDNEKNVAVGAGEPYVWDCILFTQYIDPNEPGRLFKTGDAHINMANIKEAKNTKELVEALRKFDVHM